MLNLPTVITRDGIRVDGLKVDTHPDECPVCHAHIDPVFVTSNLKLPRIARELELVFRCPKHKCQCFFIARYRSYEPGSLDAFNLSQCVPKTAAPVAFSAEIQTVSPTFVDVFRQCMAAEVLRLDQLTGIGLRKGLEFLLKDFLIAEKPALRSEIEAERQLARCIQRFVDDPRIKECAKRAAWLGNDETHYLREWKSKDIEDLKTLVRLTVNWVESVILTKKYAGEMPDQKEKKLSATEAPTAKQKSG